MHFKILKYPSLEDISFTVLLSEFLRQNTTNRRLEALFNQSFFLLKTPFRISGAFVGPSAAGLLMDHFSVGWATQVTTKAFPHKYFFINLNFFLFSPPVRVSHLRDPPAALRRLRLPLLQEEEERTGE